MREYVEQSTWNLSGPQRFYNSGAEWMLSSGGLVAPVDALWTAANLAIYQPFVVPELSLMRSLAIRNGSAVSGNFSLGIFALDSENKPGARIASAGGVQAGTNDWQSVSIGAVYLAPGLYFMGCSFDNNAARVMQIVALIADGKGPWLGSIFSQAAGYPLPAIPSVSLAASCVVPEMLVGV